MSFIGYLEHKIEKFIAIIDDHPDHSDFTESSRLPKDHWIHLNDYDKGAPPPFLRRESDRQKITIAACWAIKVATNCGKNMDLDPDTLVQNLVYAMTGPKYIARNDESKST